MKTFKKYKKFKVLLVADKRNYPFYNIAREISLSENEDFEFEILSLQDFPELLSSSFNLQPDGFEFLFEVLTYSKSNNFDLIHFFWRESLNQLDSSLMKTKVLAKGLSWHEFEKKFIFDQVITTAIYDHIDTPRNELQKTLNRYAKAYYVSSHRLFEKYTSDGFNPHSVIMDGVSLHNLRVNTNFQNLSNKNVINLGWVGNSKWGGEFSIDHKGLNTIIVPAVKELNERNDSPEQKFILKIADSSISKIPLNKMSDFYSGIDIYINASKNEGTPNPILESMACGIPIITTDVGIVNEVFGNIQKKYILRSRESKELADKIEELVNDNNLMSLRFENLNKSLENSWAKRIPLFHKFFLDTLIKSKSLNLDLILNTKICTIPFINPSIETNGSARLCSAASIANFKNETNMGNIFNDGLKQVWTARKYVDLRTTLISEDKDLNEFCFKCEYRFTGPMWVLKLNLAITAWNNGFKSESNKKYISSYIEKFDEYKLLALKYRLDASYPEGFVTFSDLDSDKIEYPSEIANGTALPIYIDVNTTNRCNAACIMCPPSLLIENGSQKRDPLFMFDKDKLNSILDSPDIQSIHFVGAYAEPLLNKDIYDLIKISSDKGVFTAVTSNAQLLDKAASVKLIESGLKMLSISLHGSSKLVAESVMGKSNFETTISNLESLSNLKKELNSAIPLININFVGMVNNIQDLEGVISLADKIGAPTVNCFHLLDGESVVDGSLSLTTNPSLARNHIPNAMKIASELGVALYVSPEYLELIQSD